MLRPYRGRLPRVHPTAFIDSSAQVIGDVEIGEMRPLDDIEAEAIRFAITHYRGQMSEVARRLRIGRSTLYRKLDSLGLDSGEADAETPAL